METKISEADLASSVAEIVDRVRQGEQFIIVRDGEEVAVLSQTRPSLSATVQEVADKLKSLTAPGDATVEEPGTTGG